MRRLLTLAFISACGFWLAQTIPFTQAAESGPRHTFAEWKAACAKLPSNRSLRGRMPPKELLPMPTFAELDGALSDFFQQCKTGALGQTNLWVGELPSADAFFNTKSGYFLKPSPSAAPFVAQFIPKFRSAGPTPPFQPFAAKVEVSPDAEIFFRADLHGDIHSLMADLTWLNDQGYLRDFTVAKPSFYMVLTGDYTDRGRYGAEVLYTLLRLKLANPNNVFLLRGNHEEMSIASRYGFLSEGVVKYGAEFDAQKVVRAYDFLPVVLYIGTSGNLIQCHHGGMEPGFDPRPLLSSTNTMAFKFLGMLNQQTFLESHPDWIANWDRSSKAMARRSLVNFLPEDPIAPTTLGFMWNDFSVMSGEQEFSIDPGRAFVYGEHATQYLLNQARTERNALQAVFRGHQQSSAPNPLMRRIVASRGVFRHWQANDPVTQEGASVAALSKQLDTSPERTIPSGSVWTFNVAPDSVYGEGNSYTFDAFGILKAAKNFSDWRLRVVNVEIRP